MFFASHLLILCDFLSLHSPLLLDFICLPLLLDPVWSAASHYEATPCCRMGIQRRQTLVSQRLQLLQMWDSSMKCIYQSWHTRHITHPVPLSEPFPEHLMEAKMRLCAVPNAAAQHRPLVANGAGADALQRLSSLSAASALLSLSSHSLGESWLWSLQLI